MTFSILQDRSKSGKIRPWAGHKIMNELLSRAYEKINERKAARLKDCASALYFLPHEEGLKLRRANFCRVRLCPMCTWRRSLKVSKQMNRIMDAIREDKPKAYIMLTLTMENCKGDDLGSSLDKMLLAFNLLVKLKDYKDASLGYYRAVEVTHNLTDNTYHPHIHAIFCVNQSYFSSRDYVKQERWTELWKSCLDVDYTPIVHVQKIKGNTAKAVAEVAKYSVKSNDYIIPYDWDLTVETVRLLDVVLHKRKFVGFGGVFREYHKKLNLDDADDGNLVHIDGDMPTENEDGKLICFAWYSGYRQYRCET